jgi:hypothetical protein
MNGLKDWAMEVNYNSSRKSRIQQETHGLTIKKILKRLDDLEEMVQDQGNLLEEQTLIIESNKEKSCMLERIVEEQRIIIESNNERIGLLERIVEENKKSLTEKLSGLDDIVDDHRQLLNEVIDEIVVEREKVKLVKCEKENNHKLIVCDKKQFLDNVVMMQGQIDNLQYSSTAIYINHAVFRIISALTKSQCSAGGGIMTQDDFIRFREFFSRSALHQVVTTIDSDWTVDDFYDVVNSTITTFHGRTRYVLYHAINSLHVDAVVQDALMTIEGCSVHTRLMFSSEEKILRSHEKLKPLYEYLLRWDNSQNKFDTR